ncbi:MAG TPA: SpoIIE family protein phosphatase [Verrucomicrobiae bacterium]|nr:SpoIIE family protein phosphatase [Verrucomicrobiae bacterium]
MQSEIASLPSVISWGVASRALPGESVSGDMYVVKPIADGYLLAVVDGLGHGDEAVLAARATLPVLEAYTGGPLDALVKRCHEALRQTRGVVMTVATLRLAQNQLTWLGVGSVEACLLRAADAEKVRGEGVLLRETAETGTLSRLASAISERVLLRSGIVGYQLPKLHTSTLTLGPGDLLAFATDGIGAGFTKELPRSNSPQQLADQILEKHFKGNDDALVLVVCYLGASHE